MTLSPKDRIKQVLATVPGAAKVYWRILDRGGPTLNFTGNHSLERLRGILPEWCAHASVACKRSSPGKDLMIFSTFRYWIEHATLLGLSLVGLGHRVTLTYLPYARYKIPTNLFDLQRQDTYVESVLRNVGPLLRVCTLFNIKPIDNTLPAELAGPLEEISLRDAQFSMKVEDVDREDELYRLRVARNEFAARVALTWLQEHPPQVVIIPNGSILEFGVVYHAARYLNLPVVTYEFDEPQQRIRLAQNAEVMREDTTEFWRAQKDREFTLEQREKVRSLLAARQRGSLWENFPIQFQGVPRQGEQRIRTELGLDARPVVLLAPNVFGDSATLSRQIFSRSMSEWLERTVEYFTHRPDIQVVIRVHPSESRFPYGTSMAEVVEQVLPILPEHFRLINAEAPINTYDLVEIAVLGVVYTTTVGMEMAMSGVPVVVSGFTHYRGKGFTLDPDTWDEYFETLDRVLEDPEKYRLSEQQVSDVWHYAYRFFFEFTQRFPWHLLYFWDDVAEWPLDRVLGEEGQRLFSDSFRILAGEPLDWSALS